MTDRGVAIVTGGASGIGLATARALLADGWKIMIADLTPAGLETARAALEPLRANATKYVIMDVADEASVIAGPGRLRGRPRAGPRPGQFGRHRPRRAFLRHQRRAVP